MCSFRNKKVKKFLIVFIFLTAGFFFAAQFVNAEAPKKSSYVLTFESVYPKGHPRLKFVEACLDQIEEKSQDSIKFFRNYKKPARRDHALDALAAGNNIDILAAYPTYYSQTVAIGGWQQIPGNFRNWEDCWELCVNGEVADLMDGVYQKLANAKYLGAFPIGPYNFQVTKKSKKIRNFEDFKGMKIRSLSNETTLAIKNLGAIPVEIMGGDYYKIMQKGVIDAGLMPNYTIKQYKLWEVCDEIVDPPFIGYSVGFIWINLNTWNKLDDGLKKIILDTIRSKELWQKWVSNYEEEQDSPVIKEAKENKIEFYELPKPDADKMYEAVSPIWGNYIEECKKQGSGAEAEKISSIIRERFNKPILEEKK